MSNQEDHLLKLVLKNGQLIGLYCDDSALAEVMSHPKFIKMNDKVNDIFISIEDVAAFEIASNRKEPPKENNGESQNQPTEEKSPEQA